MTQISTVAFVTAIAVFVVVGGFWAWATFAYISGAQKLAALPEGAQKNAEKGLEQLSKIVTNKLILGAMATSSAGAIFSLIKN